MPGDPIALWRGDFGAAYVERNPLSEEAISDARDVFERILHAGAGEAVQSILEVGANVGIRLHGLRRLLGSSARLTALEPNAKVCDMLRQDDSLCLEDVLHADAAQIPAASGSYDLVFTSGVLIHIPPEKLTVAMREIARVSRRYVLAIEYFSKQEMEIPYHGRSGMLWKRDFGQAYLDNVPSLCAIAYGFLWHEEFPTYDDLNWWLMEHRSSPGETRFQRPHMDRLSTKPGSGPGAAHNGVQSSFR